MEYLAPLGDSSQALDFTAKVEEASAEPILDLSFKKTSPTRSESTSSRKYLKSPGRCSNPPASTRTSQEWHTTEPDRKSPCENRTYMITPPSESESPYNVRCQPIFNYIDANIIAKRGDFVPMNSNIAVPSVPTVLPTFIDPNGGTDKTTSDILAAITNNATTNCKDVSSITDGKRPPRPFKAYPKDPLALTIGTAELVCEKSNEAYTEFRKRMLESVRKTNEATNAKMRRAARSPGLPTSTSVLDEKDAAYWEKRRKNNEAAKRSRDARRAKEDEIAIRAAFLEQENMKLKYELVVLRNEAEKLRCMVYSN